MNCDIGSFRMDYLEESVQCKGSNICSPTVNATTGDICYVSGGTGSVYCIDGRAHKAILSSGGTPAGIAFDHRGELFIADLAHTAILRRDEKDHPAILVKVYEEKPFHVCASRGFE